MTTKGNTRAARYIERDRADRVQRVAKALGADFTGRPPEWDAAERVLTGVATADDVPLARMFFMQAATMIDHGDAIPKEARRILARLVITAASGNTIKHLDTPARKHRDLVEVETIAAVGRIFDLFGLRAVKGGPTTKAIAEILEIKETKVRDAKRDAALPNAPEPLLEANPETGEWIEPSKCDPALAEYAFLRQFCADSRLWWLLTSAPSWHHPSATTRDQIIRFREEAAKWDQRLGIPSK